MLTVIIATASRPSMLRTALQSVADQTACQKIDTVLVSENGGTKDSENICAQFPTLPITYLFRAPTMTPLEHMQLLMQECPQSELTAILHDDDWWAPPHLMNAIQALESHPNAAAYGSSNFVISGESSLLNCNGNLFPWFGANYPAFKPIWEISRLNVLLGELLGTISHYSTLVARTEILKKAAYVFDLKNSFDNDRMLIFALSAFHSFIYNPIPEVFVRCHGVQDCFSFSDESRLQHMCKTTEWMVQTSGKSWELIATNFAKRMALCPAEAMPTLRALASKAWCLPEIARHLKDPSPFQEFLSPIAR